MQADENVLEFSEAATSAQKLGHERVIRRLLLGDEKRKMMKPKDLLRGFEEWYGYVATQAER